MPFEWLAGANDWAEESLEHRDEMRKLSYNETRPSPYFARVDFQEDGKKEEHLYFGYKALNLGRYEVIEWRAPLGRLIASSSAEHQSVQTPGGKLQGRLLLRRRFKIEEAILQEIADEFDRREGQPVKAVEFLSGQQFLLEALYSRGDPRLQDIVQTIQQQQDEIIRAPHDRIIILNGVAGSGKTSIALHRMAYLLFPDNQTNIKASRSIVFCPNRIFLHYIEDLLPGLGEKNVRQTTFLDWALARLRLAGKVQVLETLQDSLLSGSGDPRQIERPWKRAQLKGRLKIKRLLERCLQNIRLNLVVPAEGFRFSGLGELDVTIAYPPYEITDALQASADPNLPYARQRERTYAALHDQLDKKYDQAIWRSVERLKKQAEQLEVRADAAIYRGERKSLLNQANARLAEANDLRNRAFAVVRTKVRTLRQAEELLQKAFDALWPTMDGAALYYQLLGSRDLLEQAGGIIYTPAELDALQQSPPAPGCIEAEDIPALLFLHQRIYNDPRESYDHIVIDEAQDFSPLQFDLIRQCSKDGSMTIVGDLAQGIHAFRGISSWEELTRVFSADLIQFENIFQSYRSTGEIVALSNHILKKVRGDKAVLAEPFARHGSRPTLQGVASQKKLLPALVEHLEALQKEGYTNIAILVKSRQQADSLIKELSYLTPAPLLRGEGKDSALEAEFKYRGGLVVLPAALAKGIEFEAVILFNASQEEFSSEREYDGRLLYVAVTRALHALHILYTGELTGYLQGYQEE